MIKIAIKWSKTYWTFGVTEKLMLENDFCVRSYTEPSGMFDGQYVQESFSQYRCIHFIVYGEIFHWNGSKLTHLTIVAKPCSPRFAPRMLQNTLIGLQENTKVLSIFYFRKSSGCAASMETRSLMEYSCLVWALCFRIVQNDVIVTSWLWFTCGLWFRSANWPGMMRLESSYRSKTESSILYSLIIAKAACI